MPVDPQALIQKLRAAQKSSVGGFSKVDLDPQDILMVFVALCEQIKILKAEVAELKKGRVN